jgi:hypothetical protein
MARESTFQAVLVKNIRNLFPDCIILKNDANYLQGIPDLLILNRNKWAALETKRALGAKHRPNQDYYINKLNEMSYAAYVNPENKERILYELQNALGS